MPGTCPDCCGRRPGTCSTPGCRDHGKAVLPASPPKRSNPCYGRISPKFGRRSEKSTTTPPRGTGFSGVEGDEFPRVLFGTGTGDASFDWKSCFLGMG